MLSEELKDKLLNEKQKQSLLDKRMWLDKLINGSDVEKDIASLILGSAESFKNMDESSTEIAIEIMGLSYFYGVELKKLSDEYDIEGSKVKSLDKYQDIIDYIGKNPDDQMKEVLYNIMTHLNLCIRFGERSESKEAKEILDPAKDLLEQVNAILGSEKIGLYHLKG